VAGGSGAADVGGATSTVVVEVVGATVVLGVLEVLGISGGCWAPTSPLMAARNEMITAPASATLHFPPIARPVNLPWEADAVL
jgi:flagellar biogenesis protein FliO